MIIYCQIDILLLNVFHFSLTRSNTHCLHTHAHTRTMEDIKCSVFQYVVVASYKKETCSVREKAASRETKDCCSDSFWPISGLHCFNSTFFISSAHLEPQHKGIYKTGCSEVVLLVFWVFLFVFLPLVVSILFVQVFICLWNRCFSLHTAEVNRI